MENNHLGSGLMFDGIKIIIVSEFSTKYMTDVTEKMEYKSSWFLISVQNIRLMQVRSEVKGPRMAV